MLWHANKLQKELLPENTGTAMPKERITVLFAVINCSGQTQNLPAVAAGQVFLNHSGKTALYINRTIPMECNVQKWNAAAAIPISDIFSTMGLRRLTNAFA